MGDLEVQINTYYENNYIIPEKAFRFKKITYTINENNCWICNSHVKDEDGYPKITRNKKGYRLSRYIYQLEKGCIPDEFVIMHTCDNPSCINPEHLVAGTVDDNIQDKIKKKRQAKGVNNGAAKLTPIQVKSIYQDNRNYRTIAKNYNIHYSLVGLIKNKKIWKEINS